MSRLGIGESGLGFPNPVAIPSPEKWLRWPWGVVTDGVTPTATVITFVPFWVPRIVQVDRFGIHANTSIDGGSDLKVGLYSVTKEGKPDTLKVSGLFESALFSSSGEKTINIEATLHAGVWMFAMLRMTVDDMPALRRYDQNLQSQWNNIVHGHSNAGVSSLQSGWISTGADLPKTARGITLSELANVNTVAALSVRARASI